MAGHQKGTKAYSLSNADRDSPAYRFTMPEALHERLVQEADRRGLPSKSAAVREAIELWIATPPTLKKDP